ncbi:MAG: DnaJ domain-containing protein [Planctomycetota bacterium]
MSSDIGEVVDLSATGMRAVTRGKPPFKVGQVVPLRLRITQGSLNLHAQIVRVRRQGLRSYDIGIRFVKLDAKLKRALQSLAEFGFIGAKTTGTMAPIEDDDPPVKKSIPKGVTASVDLPNYYKILGVTLGATGDDIQTAYRQLARQFHPDVAPGDDNLKQFLAIKQAYEILRDPKRREIFDQQFAA